MSEQPFEANILSHLRADFKRRFDAEPRIFRAPGRVNLIGEHTDYNDGYVLPAAIDLEMRIAYVPTDDGRVRLGSDATGDEASFEVTDPGEHQGGWRDYVAGTAWAMERAGLATH